MKCCGKATWTVVDKELGNMGQACFECGACFPIPKYDDCDGRGKMYLCWKAQVQSLRSKYHPTEKPVFMPDLSKIPPSLEETVARPGAPMTSVRRYGRGGDRQGGEA